MRSRRIVTALLVANTLFAWACGAVFGMALSSLIGRGHQDLCRPIGLVDDQDPHVALPAVDQAEPHLHRSTSKVK